MADFQSSLSYKIAIAGIIGALYVVLVWLLPFISFFVWQVRLADFLIPQALLFGIPAALGLAIGCFTGNLIGGLGLIDYFGGAIANFLAGFIGYEIEKRNKSTGIKRILKTQLAIGIQTAINVFIVGTYLSYLFALPLLIGWLGILIGSLIAMHFIGFVVYEILRGTELFEIESQSEALNKSLDQIIQQFK
ncbi:MAG: QueT transporter family protein [Candidatus Helarchaeota archaeon]